MEIPSEIIHRIQHFLNAAEAAKTTVLSKSWCSAWSTRPDLDLDKRFFSYRMEKYFSEFAMKTMKRYEDLNLNIQRFKLWCWDYDSSRDDVRSLATELIQKAMKLGATDIQIGFPPSSYFLFQLPDELLRSQTLARLSLSGFIVDLPRIKNNDDGAAADLSSSSSSNPNLKSLNLCRVIKNGDFIRDLASRWPLIEELTLEAYHENGYVGYEMATRLGEVYFHVPECRDVTDTLLWRCDDALANFPCLKQLVICDRRRRISEKSLLSSRSLECIRIRLLDGNIWNAEFDVPNIRMFEYEGSPLSRFEFKETSCKGSWESDIRVRSPYYCDVIPRTWFSSLNTFVKTLSLSSSSRVSLSIKVKIPSGESCVDGCCCRDGVAAPAAVENLSLEGGKVSLCFVEKMILSCRPKFIYIEKQNVKLFEELRVQPWMTLLGDASKYKRKFDDASKYKRKFGDASKYKHKFVRFLLK